MPENIASESACDKRFKKILSLDDLLTCARVSDAVRVSFERRHEPKRGRDSGPTM
jgi:hypothetical protein